MNKILIVFSFILFAFISGNAQSNLVLNPSFEQHYDTFDVGIYSFDRGFVTNWSDPNHGSSDYFVPHSNGDYTTPLQIYSALSIRIVVIPMEVLFFIMVLQV